MPRKYLPGVLSRSCHGVAVCGAQLVLGGLLLMLAVWRMVLQVTLDSGTKLDPPQLFAAADL